MSATHKCPWCGLVSDGATTSCPACGATIDAKGVSTDSGWSELPGRKDMAKLQMGRSSCQIEGNYVPVADLNLAAGDGVYFAHHVLLWKEPRVTITTMPMKGAWKRLLSGMPLVMTQAHGPGHIAFSRDAPGEMIALPLEPGREVDVREHLFLVATTSVEYTWFNSGIWFTTGTGNERETHYPLGMFMDRFTSPSGPGLLLLHAAGNAFVRELAANERILVKPTALLFKDPSVSMQLHFEHPSGNSSGWFTRVNRYLWLRLHGPGRVAVQSAYSPMEDNGRTVTSHSGASERHWG